MPDYDRINAVAARHGITVIEDGAQSFGATQNGRKSCGVTTISSTSFYPAKPLGCYGDGSALFTSDDALADKMRAIRTHGGIIRHEHTLVGMNGRFDTIQAAVLLAKLPHFEWEIAERQRLGTRYSELLSDVCVTPAIAPGDTHVYAQYTIRLPDRDAVATKLKAAGIPTAVFYPKCLHEQSVFARLATVGGRSQWLSKLRARFSASPCIRFLERPTSIGSLRSQIYNPILNVTHLNCRPRGSRLPALFEGCGPRLLAVEGRR